jgi:hypothetical protein
MTYFFFAGSQATVTVERNTRQHVALEVGDQAQAAAADRVDLDISCATTPIVAARTPTTARGDFDNFIFPPRVHIVLLSCGTVSHRSAQYNYVF